MNIIYNGFVKHVKENNAENFFCKYRIPASSYIAYKNGKIISHDQCLGNDDVIEVIPVRNANAFNAIFERSLIDDNADISDARCYICNKQAITYQKYIDNHFRYQKKHYCTDCFLRYIKEKSSDRIEKHCLIEKNDRILAPLSGGKDGLMELLLLKLYALENEYNNQIFAYTVITHDTLYDKNNTAKAQAFCKEYGVQHIIIDARTVAERFPEINCYYCSQTRRTIENILVKKLLIDKVLSGKNMSDYNRQGVFRTFMKAELEDKTCIQNNCEVISLISCFSDYETSLFLKCSGVEYGEHFKYECPYSSNAFRERQTVIADLLEDYFPNMISQYIGKEFIRDNYVDDTRMDRDSNVYKYIYKILEEELQDAELSKNIYTNPTNEL